MTPPPLTPKALPACSMLCATIFTQHNTYWRRAACRRRHAAHQRPSSLLQHTSPATTNNAAETRLSTRALFMPSFRVPGNATHGVTGMHEAAHARQTRTAPARGRRFICVATYLGSRRLWFLRLLSAGGRGITPVERRRIVSMRYNAAGIQHCRRTARGETCNALAYSCLRLPQSLFGDGLSCLRRTAAARCCWFGMNYLVE